MTKASLNQFPYVTFAESASPGTPSSGLGYIYASTGGTPYYVNDGGTETSLLGGGSGDVATDAIWDAAGDLAVGTGANTAARLAIGNAGGAVSRVNGSVAWNSGTAFPTAATGDRYWRTDLGLECYYDGTRWVSTTLYTLSFGVGDAVLPLSADAVAGRASTWNGTYDLWLVSFRAFTYVTTTNNGTNYWTVQVLKNPAASAVASFTTAADSANTFTSHSASINALIGTTQFAMDLKGSKTLSPGNLYVSGFVTYRLVVT